MPAKRIAIVMLSLAVSLALLLLILRDVPLADVWESLRAADLGLTLLALLMVALGLGVRGIRWAILLDGRISIPRATHLVNIMFLGNQLPLRLGEVARGMLAARYGVPLATSASSIVAERLIDSLAVALVIAFTLASLPDALPELARQASLFGLLALAGFLCLLALARFPALAQRLLGTSQALIPPLRRLPLDSLLRDLLLGLQPLAEPRSLLVIAFWTLVGWLFSFGTFYALHLALGIETDYMISVPLGIALAALAIALPVSIAGLGPFHGAVVLAGQLAGMQPLQAVALGFLFHGVTVLSYALWGSLGLLALGLSPRSAFAGDDEAARPAQPSA